MKKSYDPLKVQLDEKPAIIVSAMDKLVHRDEEYEIAYKTKKRLPRLLFFFALGLFVLDLLFGFAGHPFVIAAIIVGVVWLFVRIKLWRARPGTGFSPHFYVVRELLYTIRDDIHPNRTFFGQLDLSGFEQKSKIAREVPDAAGRKVLHYRDEWLSLKGKLYDGNMLRLSVIERAKVRASYWKRNTRGKYKKKPAKYKEDLQEMKVRLAANPDVYLVRQSGAEIRVGNFVVQTTTADGIVSISAVSSVPEVTCQEILDILKWAYDHLMLRASV